MLHGPPGFERGQDSIGIDGCALKDFISKRIRKRVQDGSAPSANRRLADASRAHGRFGIRDVERGPLHIHWRIQNCWWLAVVHARREHGAIVRVVYPLLTERMTHPQNRSAKHLPAESAGMN